jgi:uncharacterized protein (TIGR00251 family)
LLDLNEKDGAVTFRVRVQPRAPKTAIVGEYAGALKLRLAAPPVDGKANDECRKFLAKLFRVPAAAVEIVSGEFARDKIIRVHQITKSQVQSIFSATGESNTISNSSLDHQVI